jgi:hypothetical protein
MRDDADHPTTHPQPWSVSETSATVSDQGCQTLVDERAVEIHRADGTPNLIAKLQGRE